MSIPLAMSPVGYDTWVTELKRALYDYLGQTGFEVEYLSTEKKLVINTDKVSEEEYAEVVNIAAEYMPAGTTLEQYNYIVPFIRLDYLEFTGEQYIATGIKASINDFISTQIAQTNNTTGQTVFRAYAETDDGVSGVIRLYFTTKATAYLSFGYWNTVTISAPPNEKHTFKLGQNYYEIDGVEGTLKSAAAFTSTSPYFLSESGLLFCGRIYSFSIARSGTLQLNFIPCLDNTGKPCMYDTVTGTPFYNQRAGDDFDFGAKYTNELQFSKALSMLPASSTDRIFKVSVPEEVLASPLIQKLMQKCRTEKNWIIQTIN